MNRRLFALFLIFAFLISGTETAFAVPKDPEVFMIRSSGDFMEFAESCAVDSWSEGRRIELVADIDMSMEHYVPAAIFKGVFEGNGHTVSGILIEASGSALGLFRYNDGEIRNVTVDMTYSGSGTGTKSGGEQQRVCIASAIAKRPRILLCDEPTGALDPENSIRVMIILQNLVKEQHIAVVMITHNTAFSCVADHCIVMSAGMVIEDNRQPFPLYADQLQLR